MTKPHVLSLHQVQAPTSQGTASAADLAGLRDRVAMRLSPYEDEERELVAYLDTQPRFHPHNISLLTRFPANQCHLNVARYLAENQTAFHVLGWLDVGDGYLMHSVAGIGNKMVDVTPVAISLPFVPDPLLKLQWRRGNPGASRADITRSGQKVPGELRTPAGAQEYFAWGDKMGGDPRSRTFSPPPEIMAELQQAKKNSP